MLNMEGIFQLPSLFFILPSFVLGYSPVVTDHSNHAIYVAPREIGSDYIFIYWESIYKQHIDFCDVSYGPRYQLKVQIYYPTNDGFHIKNLERNTTYLLNIVCFDKKKQKYFANGINFTTTEIPDMVIYHSLIKPHKNKLLDAVNNRSSVSIEDVKLLETSAVQDVPLGVVLSIFGCTVIFGAGFYIWSRWRRQQQIRRLFSRSEYQDNFPTLPEFSET